MATFQAKIDWGRRRKRQNKNCRFVPFRSYLTRNRKFQKNSNKIEKIKKYHYGVFSSQNSLGMAEKERKSKLSFRFVPTRRLIENFKKIKNIKKYHYCYISSRNRLEKDEDRKSTRLNSSHSSPSRMPSSA